jgi:hypothetical protein
MTDDAGGGAQLPVLQCEQVIAALEGYLAGALPLADLLAIAGHLESCLPCMHTLELRRAAFLVITSVGDDGNGRSDARA